MPEIGTETWQRAASLLPGAARVLADFSLEDAAALLPDDAPAVRCALESAFLDLSARVRGCSVAYLLNPDAVDKVAVNAACGAVDTAAIRRCRMAINSGFHVLKLKLGLFDPVTEVHRLLELAAALPSGVSLRLDANQAWNPDEARFVLDALAGAPIDCLEEPLKVPEMDDLWALQERAVFPIALDESLADIDIDALLQARPVSRLVLKPMACGGPRAVMELARRAEVVGIESVITTSIDSAVGVAVCLHLAAALHNGLAHGLATSELLMSDVAVPIPVANGRMQVPVVPGLGVL